MNTSSTPSYLSSAAALSRVREGVAGLLAGVTDCAVSLTPRLYASYLGTTTGRANMTSAECGSADGKNVVDFGDLPSTEAARNCFWYTTWPVHEVTEADIRFNSSQQEVTFYATDLPPSPCNGRYDLEGIATHETGHTFGLLDLDSSAHPNLTMRGQGLTDCSDEQRTLGLGDILGLNAMY